MFELGTFIVSIIGFLILFWLIKVYGLPPLARMLEKRRQYVESQLGEAEQNRAQAEEILSEQRRLLEQARQQARDMLEAARARAEEQARDIVGQAQSEAQRLLEANRQMLERERAEAMQSVLAAVSALTVEISEKLLRRHVTEDVHADMLREAEQRLGELVC